MASFRLPSWVVARIDKIRRGFIWGRNRSMGSGISLVCWDIVRMPRDWGGLGISDIRLQNTALLLRWWWLPNSNPSALWSATVMRIKVSVRGRQRRWNSGGSFFWKSLLKILLWYQWSVSKESERMAWRWQATDNYSANFFYLILQTAGRTNGVILEMKRRSQN
jgi:hypothetical protein